MFCRLRTRELFKHFCGVSNVRYDGARSARAWPVTRLDRENVDPRAPTEESQMKAFELSITRCLAVLSVLCPIVVAAQGSGPAPIIDMHLHANRADIMGASPVAACPAKTNDPYARLALWDGREPWSTIVGRLLRNPPCAKPLWSPRTDDENLRRTLDVLKRRNVIAVASGVPDIVDRWKAAAPDRIIPAAAFDLGQSWSPPLDTLRRWFQERRFLVFGEIGNQYTGVLPSDSLFEPYLAMAEELDVPVGIHMGPGMPGAPYLIPRYRARSGSPLLLENALVRHSKLRVYVMHAGWPMLDEMVALLFSHPQVYVDVGVIDWAIPRPEFHRYLQRLVEAGFGLRIMFGSDQLLYPEVIEHAIESIESAPFLSAGQKRDILYNNAK
jgi:predicted TIM-barrel fold metal-dependent hydrolase